MKIDDLLGFAQSAKITKRTPTMIRIGAIVRLTTLLSFSDHSLFTRRATSVTSDELVDPEDKICE